MPELIEAIVNPKMLVWARLKSGLDINGAAKRIGVKPERLEDWENGGRRPTITQAIKMAGVYKRPLSAFYLDEVPSDTSIPLTDFRRLPESEPQGTSPALVWELRQSETRRALMLDFAEDEKAGVFHHRGKISVADDVETAARIARGSLGIAWAEQSKWSSPNEAWNAWRKAVEQQGILVFQTNPSGKAVDIVEARGFSITAERFPVITINSLDWPRAKNFTLLHEYAHLLMDEGGICDCWEYQSTSTDEARAEVFCNHVAAAVLMPASLMLVHETIRNHVGGIEWSEAEIERLSEDFSVSQEAIVRRLLTLGRTHISFYQQKRAEYSERLREYRKRLAAEDEKKGVPPYHRMVLSRIGKPFTVQILTAYHDRQITLADASEYIGAKVKFVKRLEAEVANIGA